MRVAGLHPGRRSHLCPKRRSQRRPWRFVALLSSDLSRLSASPNSPEILRLARRLGSAPTQYGTSAGTSLGKPRDHPASNTREPGRALLRPQAESCFHAIGRDWQCAPCRWTSMMPDLLVRNTGRDGARHTPVCLHRRHHGHLRAVSWASYLAVRCRFPLVLGAGSGGWWRQFVRRRADAGKLAGVLGEGLADSGDLPLQRIMPIGATPWPALAVLLVVACVEAEQRTVALRLLGGEARRCLAACAAVRILAAEATPPDLRSLKATGLHSCWQDSPPFSPAPP